MVSIFFAGASTDVFVCVRACVHFLQKIWKVYNIFLG